jgi:hypothetical protein
MNVTAETKSPPAHAEYEAAVVVNAPDHELDGMTLFLYPGGHARIQIPKQILIHGALIGLLSCSDNRR